LCRYWDAYPDGTAIPTLPKSDKQPSTDAQEDFSAQKFSFTKHLEEIEAEREKDTEWLVAAPDNATLNLKRIGCSDLETETISLGEARSEPVPWGRLFNSAFWPGLAITLTVSLALYALVRAIGWVIGGFAAS
jgi:hypothetical protein